MSDLRADGWRPLQLSTGRWFVVRHIRGRRTMTREFLKVGGVSAVFLNEFRALGRAMKLNAAAA